MRYTLTCIGVSMVCLWCVYGVYGVSMVCLSCWYTLAHASGVCVCVLAWQQVLLANGSEVRIGSSVLLQAPEGEDAFLAQV